MDKIGYVVVVVIVVGIFTCGKSGRGEGSVWTKSGTKVGQKWANGQNRVQRLDKMGEWTKLGTKVGQKWANGQNRVQRLDKNGWYGQNRVLPKLGIKDMTGHTRAPVHPSFMCQKRKEKKG